MTAFPEVIEMNRTKMDDFIIVACDGIWDCVSNEECAEKINKSLQELKTENDLSDPLAILFDEILAEAPLAGQGTDNMTAVIVKIKA